MTGSVLRLSYLSPERGECSVTFDKPVVRFGRDPDGDLCLTGGAEVALHHGDFVRGHEGYTLTERDPRHPLFLQGKRVRRLTVRGGERVNLGAPDGPEICVAEVSAKGGVSSVPPGEDEATSLVDPAELRRLHAGDAPSRAPPSPTRRAMPTISARELAPGAALSQERGSEAGAPGRPGTRLTAATFRTLVRRLVKPHAEVQQALLRARKELSLARGEARGTGSGHTMVVLARALMGMRQTAEVRTLRWKRGLLAVLLSSLVAVGGLSGIIWLQHERISRMAGEKVAMDRQIQAIFEEMATETDEGRLEALEARLELLMGSAADKLVQVRHASARRAQELAAPADELEVEIRKILHSFHADTYAIPPIFREALRKQVDDLRSSSSLANAFARKRRFWPKVQTALRRKQLPEELGYIAFTESRFDPSAVNTKSKASGMWQLMEEVARRCGLSVRPPSDERLDPGRASDAAACYLSKLLAEYGEESFMLVLASYNRGENGVRRALHLLAREPGGYRKRDFWHLYRLKLLPEETRDYVPKVLAAAIVLGNPEKYGLQ